MTTQIVTAESLQNLLDKSNEQKRIKIVGRALVALFNRQTEDEKVCNDTNKWNTVGFSGADAKSGSLTAKYFLKHGTLLEWQLEKWTRLQKNGRARLCKYHRQLNEIANQKAKGSV